MLPRHMVSGLRAPRISSRGGNEGEEGKFSLYGVNGWMEVSMRLRKFLFLPGELCY
jgi:hypothetical protein